MENEPPLCASFAFHSPYNNTLAMQANSVYTGGKGTDILNSTAWGQGLSAGGFGDVLRTHPLGPTALEVVQAEPGTYVPQSVNLAAALLARIGQTADPANTLNNVLNNAAMGSKGISEAARRYIEGAVNAQNGYVDRGATEGAGENFDPDNVLILSTRFANKMDPIWKNSGNIKPIEGYQDIVCHGDTLGFSYKDLDGNEINMTPREFAEILKNSPVYEGRPIRLISCQAGADGSFTAQYVANHLGVDILAPTDTVFVYPDGEIIIGPDKYHNTGTWKIFKPRG
ncbi:hypothetical protein SDC9_86376 [bioreactor metagenome]|uniref:Uncharacterized protein n=1 Tax=bioreactor metagenome TaxID=1076179 RepID=A0A644ZFT5_9ZZZZ